MKRVTPRTESRHMSGLSDLWIELGHFSVPHSVFDPRFRLLAREERLLIVLLRFQDKYLKMRKPRTPFNLTCPFNVGEKELVKHMSDRTLRRARAGLVEKGFISYKPGHTGVNSTYQIIPDGFYLNQEHWGGG